MENSDFAAYASLASLSYDSPNITSSDPNIPNGYSLIAQTASNWDGSNLAVFYHKDSNTVVYASAGTNVYNPTDLLNDALIAHGDPSMHAQAMHDFVNEVHNTLNELGIHPGQEIATGHSSDCGDSAQIFPITSVMLLLSNPQLEAHSSGETPDRW